MNSISIKRTPGGENVLKFFNPFVIMIRLWRYRDLIYQLTRREIAGRYRGTFIGMAWGFINPLIMLSVYTFVFSVIFKAKWGVSAYETKAEFALALFMGLITFNIFSETISAAPTLVLSNPNYVKKVIFPLEILVVVRLFSSAIHAVISLEILLIGLVVIYGSLHSTLFLVPVVWLPLMLFTAGCSYFLSSLGVFIRDLGPTVSMFTTLLFFITPIFYPMTAVPEPFRSICRLNPLAMMVEDSRKVVLWGVVPDWHWFAVVTVMSLFVGVLGFIWFMKSKKAFADVL